MSTTAERRNEKQADEVGSWERAFGLMSCDPWTIILKRMLSAHTNTEMKH